MGENKIRQDTWVAACYIGKGHLKMSYYKGVID
jgi:hypothetical protein